MPFCASQVPRCRGDVSLGQPTGIPGAKGCVCFASRVAWEIVPPNWLFVKVTVFDDKQPTQAARRAKAAAAVCLGLAQLLDTGKRADWIIILLPERM